MIPLMMPLAGLSFYDVSLAALECRGNRVRTAKRLGVGIRSLDAAIARHGLERWFVSHDWRIGPKGSGYKSRSRCVTREQVVEVASEGYSQKDAAFVLGIDYSYLKQLVREWGLRDHFPAHGQCVRNGHVGYAV